MSLNSQSLILSIKKHPVLVVCITLSIILGVAIFLRSGIIEQLQLELEGVNKQVKLYSANINNTAQLQEQSDFLIKANEAVKLRTLSAVSLAINLQYFYRLESEIGVKYLDLRPGGKPAGKIAANQSYVPINYMVTIQASFDKVLIYLKNIEQGAYFARINAATITGDDSTVTVNLNIDVLGSL